MPLMACSTAPPRPCQKVDCRSVSVTRSGSTADSSFEQRPQAVRTAPSTSLPDVKQLPQPTRPASVCHRDERVQVFLRFVSLRPTAVHRPADERNHFDFNDAHVPADRWRFCSAFQLSTL